MHQIKMPSKKMQLLRVWCLVRCRAREKPFSSRKPEVLRVLPVLCQAEKCLSTSSLSLPRATLYSYVLLRQSCVLRVAVFLLGAIGLWKITPLLPQDHLKHSFISQIPRVLCKKYYFFSLLNFVQGEHLPLSYGSTYGNYHLEV